jgi:hypothetical protein
MQNAKKKTSKNANRTEMELNMIINLW